VQKCVKNSWQHLTSFSMSRPRNIYFACLKTASSLLPTSSLSLLHLCRMTDICLGSLLTQTNHHFVVHIRHISIQKNVVADTFPHINDVTSTVIHDKLNSFMYDDDDKVRTLLQGNNTIFPEIFLTPGTPVDFSCDTSDEKLNCGILFYLIFINQHQMSGLVMNFPLDMVTLCFITMLCETLDLVI